MGSWKSKSLALRLLAKPPEDDANIGSFHVNTSKLFLHHKFWVILYVSTDFSIKITRWCSNTLHLQDLTYSSFLKRRQLTDRFIIRAKKCTFLYFVLLLL